MSRQAFSYIEDGDEAIQNPQTGGVWQGVNPLGNAVDYWGQCMAVSIERMDRTSQRMEKQLEVERRKKRKKRVSSRLAFYDQGWFLVDEFDDESQKSERFTVQAVQSAEVYRLDSRGIISVRMFLILLQTNQGVINIIGKNDNNTMNGLYNCFLKSGVVFSSSIAKERVKEALFSYFAPRIEQAQDIIFLKNWAGWYGNSFQYAQNCGYAGFWDFSELPILNKRFPYFKDDGYGFDEYFNILRGICDWKSRVVMMAYPFAGILASILEEFDCGIPCCLNLVLLGDFDEELLTGFLQVFNRENLQPWSMDMNEKKLQRILATTKDEVLIFDAVSRGGNEAYKSKKIKGNIEFAVKSALGKGGRLTYCHKNNPFALAVFSDTAIVGEKALNLFCGSDFMNEPWKYKKIMKGSAFPYVLTAFVEYAESNMIALHNCIQKNSQNSNVYCRCWLSVLEILADFWKSKGIDWMDELHLPESLGIQEIFCDELFQAEEWEDILRGLVRREIYNYSVAPKSAKWQNAPIYYSDEHLWIRPETFKEMLQQHGLLGRMNEMLAALKKSKILETDQEGLTRRLQISGKRFEMYQFCRATFNQLGLVEIIELAKENGND